jgi:DNA modification methylase
MSKVYDQKITDSYALYWGDCVETIQGIPDESIGYSLFSPPFAELYTYSDSEQDLGNSKDYDEFFIHFDFLIKELFRVMMSGRSISVHCIDIPLMKERNGYIGLRDFQGDIIRAFQKHNFIFHSRTVIWKNPLIEATRTKALGLMHRQLCKDSAICRQGLPDYIITMRKPGENKQPISHGAGFQEFIGEDEPVERGIKYSHEVWRRYASPVWMDINQSDTLNFREARDDKDEKHICPLQLQVIERCMTLWSNEGDTFLTPFGGIGSEAYIAIKMGRKPVSIELKKSYYDQMIKNVSLAYENRNNTGLFDAI